MVEHQLVAIQFSGNYNISELVNSSRDLLAVPTHDIFNKQLQLLFSDVCVGSGVVGTCSVPSA